MLKVERTLQGLKNHYYLQAHSQLESQGKFIILTFDIGSALMKACTVILMMMHCTWHGLHKSV